MGNMQLAADKIINTNKYFLTEVKVTGTSQHLEYEVGVNDPIYGNDHLGERYDQSEITMLGDCAYGIAGCWSTPTGYRVGEQSFSHYFIYDYTKTYKQDTVIQSDPARIVAGGNMTFDVGYLRNDKSQIIAGGTLGGTVGGQADLTTAIDNIDAFGQATVTTSGTTTDTYINKWSSGGKNKRARATASIVAYSPTTPPTYIILASGEVKQGVVESNVNVDAQKANIFADTAAGSSSANASATVYAVNTTDPTLIKTGAVNTNMPNSSLFTVNPNAAGYLIETDPRFADYRQWLSSDFMLKALQTDPNTIH
ncbi:hypothetical protein, partial [Formosimonas limnophila]|uniref:hypothetical protein n=1 Tax=Formosimonas limnophila TaxID=1384487 RepID=UPI001E4EEDA4